jgi:tripartite motif-containing protein 2/3
MGQVVSPRSSVVISNQAINAARIECSLCLHVFEDPRILPCGHTFCLQCIVRQVASNSDTASFLCSLCRQVCTLSDGDAGKLPKNYSLAAVLTEPVHCTSTTSTTSAAAVDPKLMCKTHIDQKIAAYCQTCGVLICAMCGLFSHHTHTCITTENADCEFKQKINAAARKCQKTIASHRQKISNCERELREEKSKLEKEELQLARFQSLVSTKSSFIEREAASVICNLYWYNYKT